MNNKSTNQQQRSLLPCNSSISFKGASPLVAIFIILTIYATPSQGIDIPGGDVGGTWAIEDSPYHIFGTITIPYGDTLFIDPGVQVLFMGHYQLNVRGRLMAVGTQADSIHFTVHDTTGFSDNDSNAGGWNGIRFKNPPSLNDSSKIYYCKLDHGKGFGIDDSGGAIFIDNFSKVIISNCYIGNNKSILSGFNGGDGGGIYSIRSDIIIQNCIIENNLIVGTGCSGGGVCIITPDSHALIHNNIIRNNHYIASNPGRGGGVNVGYGTFTITNNTITNNHNEDGGGIYLSHCTDGVIRNNTIAHNQIDGIKIYNSTTTIIENNIIENSKQGVSVDQFTSTGGVGVIIRNNIISHNGGPNIEGKGIYCYAPDDDKVIIENNIISHNIQGDFSSAGGIYLDSSNGNITVRNNIITGNVHGGIFSDECYNSNGLIINNLVSESSDLANIACYYANDKLIGNVIVDSDSTSGIIIINGSPFHLINNTIANNKIEQDYPFGAGIRMFDSDPIFTNTILWGNMTNDTPDQFYGDRHSNPEFYNCNVQGGIGDEIGENNIDANPMFDSTNVDHPYSLLPTSPCINAGTPDTTGLNLPELDIAYHQRVFGDTIDIGAYEYNPDVGIKNMTGAFILPTKTSLQNYPNPFNPSTTIGFTIPQDGAHLQGGLHLTLNIYDISGKLVKTLLDEPIEAGYHSVVWDGKDNAGEKAASGVYFYKLNVNNTHQQTKQMLLVK